MTNNYNTPTLSTIRAYKSETEDTEAAFKRAIFGLCEFLPSDDGHWRAIFFNLRAAEEARLADRLSRFWSDAAAAPVRRRIEEAALAPHIDFALALRQLRRLGAPASFREMVAAKRQLLLRGAKKNREHDERNRSERRGERRERTEGKERPRSKSAGATSPISWPPLLERVRIGDVFEACFMGSDSSGDSNDTADGGGFPKMFRQTCTPVQVRFVTSSRVFFRGRLYFYVPSDHADYVHVIMDPNSTTYFALPVFFDYSNALVTSSARFRRALRKLKERAVSIAEIAADGGGGGAIE